MGLPIAPFDLAYVPSELMEADLTKWLADLGEGAVFASRKVLGQELAMAQVSAIDPALRRDVLVFDWWVRNGDRCLTAKGGNVNLLWEGRGVVRNEDDERIVTGQLAVIDHNLAFDAAFSAADFCQTHVFSGDIAELFSDFVMRESYKSRLSAALAGLEAAWNNVLQLGSSWIQSKPSPRIIPSKIYGRCCIAWSRPIFGICLYEYRLPLRHCAIHALCGDG
jgi:hypothetical protein